MSTPIRNLVRKTLSPTIFTSPKSPNYINISPINRSPRICKQITKKNVSKCLNKNFEEISIKITDYENNRFLKVKEKNIPTINTPERQKFLKSDLSKINFNIYGKGTFGTVVQAHYKGKTVAMKIINKKSCIIQETNALKLDHPNILKVLLVDDNAASHNIVVMRACAPFDLQRMIDQSNAEIPLNICSKWILDICKALKYCHEKFILHLDVKPKNILLKNDNCMLCDFGNSLDLKSEIQTKLFVQKMQNEMNYGTVIYTAPELYSEVIPTSAADIYSVGITMWQLQTRCIPYQYLNNAHTVIYQVVKYNLRPPLPQINDVTSTHYSSTYIWCWQHLPKNRPCLLNIIKSLEKII